MVSKKVDNHHTVISENDHHLTNQTMFSISRWTSVVLLGKSNQFLVQIRIIVTKSRGGASLIQNSITLKQHNYMGVLMYRGKE